MLKLLPITDDSEYLSDVILLLLTFGGLIFSQYVNPLNVFLEGLKSDKTRTVGAFKDNRLIAFVTFYNFQKITKEQFSCYMYGAAWRGFAKEVELLFGYLFDDLKKQGCRVLRLETREYNLPMRNLAFRLGFKKIGVLASTNYLNGKFKNSILYEKILQ